MKLQVEIDLDDMWFEEDGSLSAQIKNALVHEIKQQVLSKMSQDTKAEMAAAVKRLVDQIFADMVNAEMTRLLIEDQIQVGGKNRTLRELIAEKFESSGWNNPEEQIKKLAKTHADEIKMRYDLMFATQIVANMSNHGLLKDEMSKLLLPQPEK